MVLQAFTLPAHHYKLEEILKQFITAEIFSHGVFLTLPFLALKKIILPLNCNVVRMSITFMYSPCC